MEPFAGEGEATKAVFLSDLHLRSMEERNGQTLLRFLVSLESLPMPPDVFLLGDIFDLWVSDNKVFIKRYEPLIKCLKKIKSRGAKIYYFEGNHDMHLAGFWQENLGAEVYIGPRSFEVAGLRIRCEHGDELNREDKAYLRLRAVLRSPALQFLAHTLPGFFWDAFGQRWSRHSRQQSSGTGADETGAPKDREDRIRAVIRAHAERVWEEDPFDLIITGHMHVVDEWTFEKSGKKITSINLGSWLQAPRVLKLSNQGVKWEIL